MSRGLVLWPDEQASGLMRNVWADLADAGLPSQANHTHRLHRPHCSLSVAAELPPDDALTAVGPVPEEPIPLLVESVGVFPPNGALFLACVANEQLLSEQRRVHAALAPVAAQPLPFYEYNAWVPHITLAMAMSSDELARAIPIAMAALPIRGSFASGGVEDGATGEHWPAARRPGADPGL